MQRKFDLHVRIQVPIRSHIWGTIIHHDITLEVLELFLDQGNALGRGDFNWKVTQPLIDLIGSKSTPILIEAFAIYLEAT